MAAASVANVAGVSLHVAVMSRLYFSQKKVSVSFNTLLVSCGLHAENSVKGRDVVAASLRS